MSSNILYIMLAGISIGLFIGVLMINLKSKNTTATVLATILSLVGLVVWLVVSSGSLNAILKSLTKPNSAGFIVAVSALVCILIFILFLIGKDSKSTTTIFLVVCSIGVFTVNYMLPSKINLDNIMIMLIYYCVIIASGLSIAYVINSFFGASQVNLKYYTTFALLALILLVVFFLIKGNLKSAFGHMNFILAVAAFVVAALLFTPKLIYKSSGVVIAVIAAALTLYGTYMFLEMGILPVFSSFSLF